MLSSIKSSFLKFTSYVFVVLLLSIGFKTVLNSKINTKDELKKQIDFENKSSKIYFIGTSRVRQSVNTNQLKKSLKLNGVYNLGLSSSSFLYNYLLAKKLIEISPPQSTIFIELCSSQPTPPVFYEYFFTEGECLNLLKLHLTLSENFEKQDNILFHFLSLKESFRTLSESNLTFKPNIRDNNDSTIFKGNNKTIFTFQEILNANQELNAIQNKYLYIIEGLINEGKRKDIHIIFFVPTTFITIKEKTLTLSIFNKILPENRWFYTPMFLAEMKKTGYMADGNHLNKYGAHIYTEELIKKIKSLDEFTQIHSQALK